MCSKLYKLERVTDHRFISQISTNEKRDLSRGQSIETRDAQFLTINLLQFTSSLILHVQTELARTYIPWNWYHVALQRDSPLLEERHFAQESSQINKGQSLILKGCSGIRVEKIDFLGIFFLSKPWYILMCSFCTQIYSYLKSIYVLEY